MSEGEVVKERARARDRQVGAGCSWSAWLADKLGPFMALARPLMSAISSHFPTAGIC